MTPPEFYILLCAIAVGLLLLIAGGVVVRLRNRATRLEALLAETQLALEGANNRLAQAKAQAALLSNIDPVTGLLVRHVVVERFQLSLALARRGGGSILGIVLLLLADFEHLADQQGPVIADKLLIAFGDRLRLATRDTDTVGRVRDYEFALLLPGLQATEDLDRVVAKLREILAPPFAVPGHTETFRLPVRIASASHPGDGDNWTSVLKAADERLRATRIQAP